MSTEMFCNNCGKPGHQFHQCKMPITSIGIIAFRIHPETYDIQFLMIRRKDTLGYMDFMRGKFPIYQKQYILNMMTQMTTDEKNRLRQKAALLKNMESKDSASISTIHIKEKIQQLILKNDGDYDLLSLLDESDRFEMWSEPEWGFPKGRRNQQEKDYDCALREFSEETGYSPNLLKNIRNIIPFEEIFIGSNYKSYRHKYYLMNMDYTDTLSGKTFQKSEVSSMEWKSYVDCMQSIRSYNVEKKQMLKNVYVCLMQTLFCQVKDSITDDL